MHEPKYSGCSVWEFLTVIVGKPVAKAAGAWL